MFRLGLCFLISCASAADLTVGPQGFKTIGEGVAELKAGDTLTILPGEYLESVELRKLAGTKDAPIMIRAQRAGTVLMRGDVEVAGWEAVAGLDGVFAVTFEKTVHGVADPRMLRHYEPGANVSEIRTKPGVFFHDAKSGRLHVRTPDARPPGVLMVSITNKNGIALENCAHITIEGLAFTGYQHADTSVLLGSRTRWGVLAGKCESITLRRCSAYLNSGGFCFSSVGGSVIEDCFAFGNASRTIGISNQILGWGAKDCVFRRNRIEGFNSAVGSQDQITFYSNDGHANLLENNIAINASFMDKGDAKNVRVVGNLTTGPKPGFYQEEDASNLRVQYTNPAKLTAQFADPVTGDFRLLPDSPQRGKGLNGADPGPNPFREEVFFVSPEGDDGASGLTPAKPWKTLTHAAAKAKAGDTIYLMPGVYEEALTPAQSGTAEKPIRFVRRGDGRVILDGKGTLPVGIDLS
ncbi:MAG: right-handed parallel beta-helix repeat-containing protein [Verrucomicrobiaceae bacterium]|nr:right-handed parallel beta-helix repeat-containing protein [Verrucomicrobiaceae bacterium]